MSQRTPPDIKWLLNERAALCGEHERASAKGMALRAKCEKLEGQLVKVLMQIEATDVAARRAQASLLALDATMGLIAERLNVAAGGTVVAWAGKYGERGALGAFVEEVLRQASPEPVTTTVLVDVAAAQFGVKFVVPTDRRNFRKSVCSALGALHKRRLIEPLHSRESGSHGVWRWRAGGAFNGEALRALAGQLVNREDRAGQDAVTAHGAEA